MKRLFSVFLVIALMLTMAAPCFAASNLDEQAVPYGTSYTSATDRKGNEYRLTCTTTIDGVWVAVYTTYKVTDYGDTLDIPFNEIEKMTTVKADVYFNDGSMPSLDVLEDEDIARGETGGAYDALAFANSIQSVNSDHTFDTSIGLVGGPVAWTSAAIPLNPGI